MLSDNDYYSKLCNKDLGISASLAGLIEGGKIMEFIEKSQTKLKNFFGDSYYFELKKTDLELIEIFANFAFDDVLSASELDGKDRVMVTLAAAEFEMSAEMRKEISDLSPASVND